MTAKLSIETFPNEAAEAYIKGKAVADPTNFGNLPPQLKQRAFAVAGIEQLNVVKEIRDEVAKLPRGANWDVVKKEIAEKISPFVGDGGMDAAARDKAAKARAEFLLRTHGFQAYSVARHQQQMATVKSRPYWMYETVGDNRVRAGHAALDGKVLRADDPWWKTHYPPWDWGCRCIVIALDEEDAQEYGISEHNDMPTPERSDSYSFDPSDTGISLDALTQGRDDADLRLLFNGARKATVQRDDGTNETMWDYMLDRHMTKTAGRLTSATERDGRERALVLDYLTGKPIGEVAVGDERSVVVDIPRNRDVATLHTHPNGDNTPSPGDILEGFAHSGKAEYIAAGKKLRRWTWLKTPEPDDARLIRKFDADNRNGGVNLDAYTDLIDRLIKTGYIKMEVIS
jgi:SPP1 gp7 family putative phage head morphogenesis protein